MICPKCKAEYRRGFTECADCGVALVESAEMLEGSGVNRENAAAPGDPNEDPFCSFWKGTDLRVCTEICAVLDEAEIPHKTIRRQDHLFNFSNQSPYEVGVPASSYENAELAIKEAFGTEAETGEDAVPLLPPPEEDPRARHLRSVWVGNDMEECVAYCAALKRAGIYYRVDEQRRAVVRSVETRYEIGVLQQDVEKANAITHDNVLDFSDEPEDQEIMELPDAGEGAVALRDSERAKSEEEWYPEDATSLAWNGEPADSKNMIEMSLKENDIRMRWEMAHGKPQLFVLPEDEERAKEIVLEILEGQAPE
jgi:hypothetical protein